MPYHCIIIIITIIIMAIIIIIFKIRLGKLIMHQKLPARFQYQSIHPKMLLKAGHCVVAPSVCSLTKTFGWSSFLFWGALHLFLRVLAI